MCTHLYKKKRKKKKKKKERAMVIDNGRQIMNIKRKWGHDSTNSLSIETKTKAIAKGRSIREVYLVVDYARMNSDTQYMNMCRVGQVEVSDTRWWKWEKTVVNV